MDRIRTIALLFAFFLCLLGARPYAGGWNDGSRFAAIEALADMNTAQIDDSIFVKVPIELIQQSTPPYPAERTDLCTKGTLDKVYIHGHYYSDKPYPLAEILAWTYSGLKAIGLPRFQENPAPAIYWLTVLSSFFGFGCAIYAIDAMLFTLGCQKQQRILILVAFCLATVAPAYTRHLNSHMIGLGLSALFTWQLLQEWLYPRVERWLLLGVLVGLFTLCDPGLAPALLLAYGIASLWFTRSLYAPLLYLTGCIPFLVWFIYTNHTLGGVYGPINAVPEYLDWPGSPFNRNNLTGIVQHTPGKMLVYTLDLLFGKYGFFLHNLPILFALVGFLPIYHRERALRPVILITVGWICGGWLIYSSLSTNFSGASCSIRWFVPFLPVASLLLALHLQISAWRAQELLWLTFMGTVLGAIMWLGGPWRLKMVPGYWPIALSGLLGWLWIYRRNSRNLVSNLPPSTSYPV